MHGAGRRFVLQVVALVAATAMTAAVAGDRHAFTTNILRDTFHYGPATRHTVPLTDLHQGCPRRDCIPAIDHPKFVDVASARFLDADDVVLAITHNGQTKAYPVRILNYHEIVNDTVGGTPLAITFCPLCGSGLAFGREIDGRAVRFGVSGVLYNSDLVMYDRRTDSLWSQIEGRAIVGPATGARLTAYPLTFGVWGTWKGQHPDALVLSTDTGYKMPYARNPYGDYDHSRRVMFPVSAADARRFPKMIVYGVEIAGQPVAYDAELLKNRSVFTDTVGGHRVELTRKPDGSVLLTDAAAGGSRRPLRLFWFAWYTFHPDTLLRTAAAK